MAYTPKEREDLISQIKAASDIYLMRALENMVLAVKRHGATPNPELQELLEIELLHRKLIEGGPGHYFLKWEKAKREVPIKVEAREILPVDNAELFQMTIIITELVHNICGPCNESTNLVEGPENYVCKKLGNNCIRACPRCSYFESMVPRVASNIDGTPQL